MMFNYEYIEVEVNGDVKSKRGEIETPIDTNPKVDPPSRRGSIYNKSFWVTIMPICSNVLDLRCLLFLVFTGEWEIVSPTTGTAKNCKCKLLGLDIDLHSS